MAFWKVSDNYGTKDLKKKRIPGLVKKYIQPKQALIFSIKKTLRAIGEVLISWEILVMLKIKDMFENINLLKIS